MIIDRNENLAKAEAEDLGHGAAFIGNPKIVGTKGDLIYVPQVLNVQLNEIFILLI